MRSFVGVELTEEIKWKWKGHTVHKVQKNNDDPKDKKSGAS